MKPDIEPMLTMLPRASGEHMPARGAAAPEGAVEIDVEDVQPMLVERHLSAAVSLRAIPALLTRMSIRPCTLCERVDLGRNIGRSSDVEIHALDRGAFVGKRCDGGVDRGLVAVGDRDARTELGEGLGDREPDAVRAARDEGDAIGQFEAVEIHARRGQ
jgi:hypothetical protein